MFFLCDCACQDISWIYSMATKKRQTFFSIAPHLGLVAANIIYVLVGAHVFVALEGPHEEFIRTDTEKFVATERMELIDAVENAHLTIKNETLLKIRIDQIMDSYTERIMHTFYDPLRANYFESEALYNGSYQRMWSDSAALLFTSTTVIPVGFGLVTPMTGWGRAFLCTYAVIGLPLALITMSDIGKFLSNLGSEVVKSEAIYSCTLLFLLPAYPILWGIMISYMTKCSMVDAIYYCSITIFTIGYGDMTPPVSLPTLLLFIVFGVILVTLTIDVVAANAIHNIHYLGRQVGNAKVIAGKMLAMAQKININRGLELGISQLGAFAKFGVMMRIDGNGNGPKADVSPSIHSPLAYDPPGLMPFADEKSYKIWTDYRLSWNPAKYENITSVRFAGGENQIWRPDILLYNSANEDFDATFKSNEVVYSTGEVNWVPPGIFRASCKMDITYFPFDDQA
ncbi:unnamed protein product, partial [Mesorhabditis spiculigera]